MAWGFISARGPTEVREPTAGRPPQDTAWGQHEGVLVDPDGNVTRFGSPMKGD